MLLSSSAGNGGESASGGAKGECESALELGVKLLLLLSAFFFWGGGGPVSFRAVKGEGGASALELGVVVVVCFLFLGGRGASQLPGCEGGRGRVSFGVVCVCCCLLLRGMEASQLPGGRRGNVSQLWSWV